MGIYRHLPPPFIGGPQPLEQNKLIPVDTPIIADDPPFGSRDFSATILAMWQPGPLLLLEETRLVPIVVVVAGRIMSSLVASGGLVAEGGIAGSGGGLAG